jgi:hypothetical protein
LPRACYTRFMRHDGMNKTPAQRVFPNIRDHARTFATVVKYDGILRMKTEAKQPTRAGCEPAYECPFYRAVPCMRGMKKRGEAGRMGTSVGGSPIVLGLVLEAVTTIGECGKT